MVRILLVVTLVTVVTASRADICRWRDADGRVHYSAFPQEGYECERTVRPSALPAGHHAARAPDYLQQEIEFRQRRIARIEETEREEKAKREAERLAEACTEARGRLSWLQSGGRVARIEANGERAFLDQDGVTRETTALRDRISKMCL
jgi:hypothetical protein